MRLRTLENLAVIKRFFRALDQFKTIVMYLGMEEGYKLSNLNKRFYNFIIPRKILKDESFLMGLK
jgi:hypothetical protein